MNGANIFFTFGLPELVLLSQHFVTTTISPQQRRLLFTNAARRRNTNQVCIMGASE